MAQPRCVPALAWNSPAAHSLSRQILAARRRGAAAEAARLLQEQADVTKKEESAIYDRLRTRGFDAELIELHAQLNALPYTNHTERAALERRLSLKLGQAPRDPAAPERSPWHAGAVSGFARGQGLLVELSWMTFKDAPTDLPALIEWLCRRQCGGIKYDILSRGIGEEEEVEE